MTQEQQPEARYADVVHHANVNSSLAYVARKTGLGYQETERLMELALQRGDLASGDYAGRKLYRYVDERVQELEAQLITQTNRAASAEQQVTALTQRLDMANAMGNEARDKLAQLSARQDAPGWKLVPVGATLNMLDTAFGICSKNGKPLPDLIASAAEKYAAMLQAAPTTPARKPLTDAERAHGITEGAA